MSDDEIKDIENLLDDSKVQDFLNKVFEKNRLEIDKNRCICNLCNYYYNKYREYYGK